MKFLIRYGWIILLMGVISACGTATPMSPVEVQMTSMAAQAQACATLQALGTPYSCNPPTATPQPTSTPTPIPPTSTPTATPFTGWMHYPETGGATPMPQGWEPNCEGLVGCPGNSYRYFSNGIPQEGQMTGTPGYWPWVLIGAPVGIVVLAMFFIVAWGSTSPQRAIAKLTQEMGHAFTAHLLSAPSGDPTGTALAKSVSSDNGIGMPVENLAKSLGAFMQRVRVPDGFRDEMFEALRHHKKGQILPLMTITTLLQSFDQRHGSNVSGEFGRFLAQSAERQARKDRRNA